MMYRINDDLLTWLAQAASEPATADAVCEQRQVALLLGLSWTCWA